MPSVTNVNSNEQGLLVLLDGKLRKVPKGESIDVTAEQAKSLLTQTGNWKATEKPHKASHTKENDK